ncbi:prephenate dehydrogenase [Alkalibacter mobilis]|uniref:prephenate dehydrogenase n=1 Tax=Alkalibacter mobilis TaxID=2787712 RepID=UPI00189CE6BF|nr:prephenate dehydrogenase [Alkalibacter mobilis]MBF7096706.1 prephenate dehydrogenase [Alkalibacter mobilis]
MESDFKNKNVLVVGIGLMGSAFAKSFKSLGFKKVYGHDINEEILQAAEKQMIIDRGCSDVSSVIGECDLVVVCLNLAHAVDFIKSNMKLFKKGSILTDIVGVKRNIIREILPVLRDDVDFIPGHPMAGREKSGEIFTSDKIFAGKNYILTLTEKNKKENIIFVKRLIEEMGFGQIIETDPETHDEKIAFTSQLCHIIAASMVDISDDSKVTRFEGGSFQDMTRIAMINSSMWAELFLANKDKLVEVLDKFQESIEFFKDSIENEEYASITDRFDIIGKKRMEMGK